jgi:hypothetical protein
MKEYVQQPALGFPNIRSFWVLGKMTPEKAGKTGRNKPGLASPILPILLKKTLIIKTLTEF